MMEMPNPTEAHRKLNALVGRWSGQEKMCPSPWDPKGSTAVGRCDNRLSVDGFVIQHDYEQERNGSVSFRGHGVLSYDSAAKAYLLHWWDSMGVAVNVFRAISTGTRYEWCVVTRKETAGRRGNCSMRATIGSAWKCPKTASSG